MTVLKFKSYIIVAVCLTFFCGCNAEVFDNRQSVSEIVDDEKINATTIITEQDFYSKESEYEKTDITCSDFFSTWEPNSDICESNFDNSQTVECIKNDYEMQEMKKIITGLMKQNEKMFYIFRNGGPTICETDEEEIFLVESVFFDSFDDFYSCLYSTYTIEYANELNTYSGSPIFFEKNGQWCSIDISYAFSWTTNPFYKYDVEIVSFDDVSCDFIFWYLTPEESENSGTDYSIGKKGEAVNDDGIWRLTYMIYDTPSIETVYK